jgi:Pectate lyase superfamily protein
MKLGFLMISIALNFIFLNAIGIQRRNSLKSVSNFTSLQLNATQSKKNVVNSQSLASRPILPAAPKIPNFSELVTRFGAVPNDGLDDTTAIQTAIDTVAKQGGGSVLFPNGTYNISIQRQGKHPQALKLRSKIRLAGSSSASVTLKLADRQDNYESILGTPEYHISLNDFAIQGLTIDSNGQKNPVLLAESNGKNSPDFGDDNNSLPRAAVRIYKGKRISIDRIRFTNQNAVCSVTVNGQLDDMTDVSITNSRFDNVGGNVVDFDHSSIYTNGSRMLVAKNIFSSRFGPGTKGARTAIEIHGNDQMISGNIIKGYVNGLNVTGIGTPVSQYQIYQDNTIEGANGGFTLWSNIPKGGDPTRPALQNIIIRRNKIDISSDRWLKLGISSASGPSAGILLEPNSDAPIKNLTIANNQINFVNVKPVDYWHDHFSSGITLWKYAHPDIPIDQLTISGNRISNAPGAGIWSNSALGGSGSSKIENNTIFNPARSNRLSEDNSGIAGTGIYLQANSKSKNLNVQHNMIVDTIGSTQLKYGVVTNSTCIESCHVQKNIVKASGAEVVRAHASWRNHLAR